jgi:hypothetical protein
LPVRFAVATQPESSYAATLTSIATASRKNEFGDHVLDATAHVSIAASDAEGLDRFRPDQVRGGADVRAKIACGRRSILGSWFGDVVDFAHRNVLFYFR